MATEHEEKLGTEDSKWLGEYSQVHMNVFGTPLRVMDHGQGAHIWDVDGNEYLDFLAGIAVNSLGYAHPKWVKAVADQAAKVAHISNYFASEPQIELASKLVKLAGAPEGSKVYFGNSGAEGNEAALKLAKLYGRTLPGALPSIGGQARTHSRNDSRLPWPYDGCAVRHCGNPVSASRMIRWCSNIEFGARRRQGRPARRFCTDRSSVAMARVRWLL